MRLLLEITGIASDVQSAAEIVDILKENARAWWYSSGGVLVLLVLLLLLVRLRIYWKASRILKGEDSTRPGRRYSYAECILLHDEYFPDSYLSVYRIIFWLLLAGLALVSLVAGIVQLVICLKYA